MTMLKVEDLNVYYGKIHALKGISFEVNKGEVVSLIGANGAGKSTTLKVIYGLRSAYRGDVRLHGKLGHLPQNPQTLFDDILLIYIVRVYKK